jgi:hypothetical protein
MQIVTSYGTMWARNPAASGRFNERLKVFYQNWRGDVMAKNVTKCRLSEARTGSSRWPFLIRYEYLLA